MIKISLAIPTMNRYDGFLKKNLSEYVENELIDEIIIVDENGNDYSKIEENFKNEKIKLFNNKEILGPFLNKLKSIELSNNDWVALIDSDNFVDYNYLKRVLEIIENEEINQNTILLPDFAKPSFNLTEILNLEKNCDKILTKENLKFYPINISFLFNFGNFVINKKIINEVNFIKDIDLIRNSPCADVLLFNTILMEQTNVTFRMVNGLEYYHPIHDGSIYQNTISTHMKYCDEVHDRFNKLKIS